MGVVHADSFISFAVVGGFVGRWRVVDHRRFELGVADGKESSGNYFSVSTPAESWEESHPVTADFRGV